jgi:tetratricopeptide (TPR) repeat protein
MSLTLSIDLSMPTSQSAHRITAVFLAACLFGLLTTQPLAVAAGESSRPSALGVLQSPACEDFAQRQIGLADRLLSNGNYTRALKVLNSTAENCNIEPVRNKIVEALGEWYGVVRRQGPSALRQYINVLSAQQHVSSAQKSRFERRIEGHVRNLIEREYGEENFRAAHQLCRTYPNYADENFEAEYFCGRSAQEVGAQGTAMTSYQWLLSNWKDQSMTNWKDLAATLEGLYFRNGRFQEAYLLARQRARRDPSPEAILSSLISARGQFLAPALRAGSVFYGAAPSQSAMSHVGTEMQRINFPKYVKAFYILAADGSVKRGMYGKEANQPSADVLQDATGTVSLLQSTGDSSLAWLVSPLGEEYLVLEFGVATTPEENVRLETVYENIESDAQWKKLYDLEFTETSPATGSAVGTILSGASIDEQDLDAYDAVFDDSSLLGYYCIQNGSGEIDASYNFDRANLGYGDSEWDRTSNTPALYHHSITYDGQTVREVVWPKFVDEKWTGVVRVGLTSS